MPTESNIPYPSDNPSECERHNRYMSAMEHIKSPRDVNFTLTMLETERCEKTCNVRGQCEKIIAKKGLEELKKIIPSETPVISIGGFDEDKEVTPSVAPISSVENDKDDTEIKA
jgi:hypothetical protein